MRYKFFGGCYVTAGRLDETIRHRFDENGLPFELSTNIIPDNDPTTLFICSGMQPLKPRFQTLDGSSHGNIQYCVRTNDIDEVGDGTHLTFFQMVGSFGFGTNNYERHIGLWHSIVSDLDLSDMYREHIIVRVNSESNHRRLWEKYGDEYLVMDDPTCIWSDGSVGGFCSEMFLCGLEIGNLVNPMTHSVDVGFGYERLYQMVCRSGRVDGTDLFRQELDPVSRDHYRTLSVFYEQGIGPGNKGRNYVCRRLIRRYIRLNPESHNEPFSEWIGPERSRMDKSLREGRRFYRRNSGKSNEFWWETFGVMPDELGLLTRP